MLCLCSHNCCCWIYCVQGYICWETLEKCNWSFCMRSLLWGIKQGKDWKLKLLLNMMVLDKVLYIAIKYGRAGLEPLHIFIVVVIFCRTYFWKINQFNYGKKQMCQGCKEIYLCSRTVQWIFWVTWGRTCTWLDLWWAPTFATFFCFCMFMSSFSLLTIIKWDVNFLRSWN